MKNLRREDLSLHHYLKNYALSDFIETETSVSLSYLKDMSDSSSYVYEASSNMDPLPNSKGRGWLYFDAYGDTTEQANSVTVYNSVGAVINSSNYDIDYIDGRVIFPNNSFNPSTVTYKWHYVAVVDEWSDVESSDVPIIVVDINDFYKEGFQLGGGKRVPRRVNLHVFASNTAERADLTEAVYDGLYLKCCPYQSFPKGTVIDWDGRFNTNYEYATVSGSSSLKIDNLKVRNFTPPLMRIPSNNYFMLSDLNRYRSTIIFDMFHWEEA